MFDGGVPEQFHQFIAAARTTPSSAPSPPPLSFPLHHHGDGGFYPFITHPTPPPHHHHLFPPPPHYLFHHKDDDRRREGDEHERRIGDESMSDRSGERPWSNHEVIALVRVRSSMEAWFPPEITWEQVSRKLAAIGFKRSGEECKEKFEEQSMRSIFSHINNIDTTTITNLNNLNFSKNNYRLLVGDQLEVDLYAPPPTSNPNPTQLDPDHRDKNILDKPAEEELPPEDDRVKDQEHEHEHEHEQDRFRQDSRTEETDTIVVKKRKMSNQNKRFEMFKGFCVNMVEKLMTQQEEMHKKLLEDLLRRDKEMVEREEAWKKIAMEKMNKELNLRAKEQSILVTRQAAIIDFLKKFTDSDSNLLETLARTKEELHRNVPSETTTAAKGADSDTGKRWPREEVLALINLRCSIIGGSNEELQVGSTKAPLWERISQGMVELGYNRSSKRCKEKWENINKYFRKTKDINTNKKRSVESRTCPYFDQLSALYNQGKLVLSSENGPNSPESDQAAAGSGSKEGGGDGE